MSHSTNSRESCECKENLRLLSLVVLTALLALSVGAFGQTQGPAVRLKASNGQYVVAEGGGGGVVNANRPQAGAWETFTLIDKNGGILMNGDAVNFKTATGHFLVAEGSGGREVLANRTAPGPWETFVMVKVKGSAGQEIVHGDAIALRASSGQYLVAEGGGGGVVNANRNAPGLWETFTIDFVGSAAPVQPPPPTVAPTKPLGPRAPLTPTPVQPQPAPQPVPPGRQMPTPQAVVAIELDTRPPGPAPTGVTGTAPGPTTIQLTWNGVQGPTGYLVMRGNDIVTTTPITETRYSDGGREPKKTYTYKVAAVYPPPPQGQYSPGWSGPVNVTTPPALPPADLKAMWTGPTAVSLTWSARRDAIAYVVHRNGTALRRVTTTSLSDQVPSAGTYWYQVAAIYRGEGTGEIPGILSSALTLANRPLNMVVVGDSLMWGQGLSEPSKFTTKVKQWLESRLGGRRVNMHHLAHSGAVIGFAENQDDEKSSTPGEVPNPFPTIAYQASALRSQRVSAADVDLVLMDGCINDVKVTRILSIDPTVGPDWVRKWTRLKCSDGMRGLFAVAMDDRWFPNAKIVVTGYFPIVSLLSGLPDVTALLRVLGILPPSPSTQAGHAPGILTNPVLLGKLASQSQAFNDEATNSLRQVVEETNANYGTDRLRFVNVPFQANNSYAAPGSWLWSVGERDEVWAERQRVCPADDVICPDAAMGHPNRTGAQAYADAITRVLEPFVVEWQAQAWSGITASLPPQPPIYILAEYGQRTPDQATMTVFAADWNTGAGVPARVKLDGADRGPTGIPITFALKPVPANSRRNTMYGGLRPPQGAVSAPGYGDVSFLVRPPVLRLKVQVTPGQDVDETTKTMTVNASEATTNRPASGTVLVNGEAVGETGKLVTYSCFDATAYDLAAGAQTDVERTASANL